MRRFLIELRSPSTSLGLAISILSAFFSYYAYVVPYQFYRIDYVVDKCHQKEKVEKTNYYLNKFGGKYDIYDYFNNSRQFSKNSYRYADERGKREFFFSDNRFCLTGIYIWNSGNRTITEEILIGGLSISVDDGYKVIDYIFGKSNQDGSQFSVVRKSKNSILLHISNLKAGKGVNIQVMHEIDRDTQLSKQRDACGFPKGVLSINFLSEKLKNSEEIDLGNGENRLSFDKINDMNTPLQCIMIFAFLFILIVFYNAISAFSFSVFGFRNIYFFLPLSLIVCLGIPLYFFIYTPPICAPPATIFSETTFTSVQ
jgi:hypothetical protein